MKFEIDKQTLEDLNILGKYRNNSIFSLFNHTVTRGGEIVLEKMFLEPFTEAEKINNRSTILSLFQRNNFIFPFKNDEFEITEQYLGNPDYSNFITSFSNNLKRKALSLIANDKEFEMLREGIIQTASFVKKLDKVLNQINSNPETKMTPYDRVVNEALFLLHSNKMKWLYGIEEGDKISFWKVALYDHKLRYSLLETMTELINIVYEMDVFITVSSIGKNRDFTYAQINDNNEFIMEIKGVFHPSIPNAVANDISITENENVIFLTGANMAGKSTLMKSFGVAIYLAQMGFPVAAKSMTFKPQKGLYTSINVPDDINKGYSHFYAEVMRVKKIAIEAASGKNLVIVFDELFKGTNVKDAYDATVAITGAFSKIKKCVFIVSTHIMEAGVELINKRKNIQFKYLPTIMKGNMPTYTYTLDNGISDDRHGMRIINNEKIIEIIKKQHYS